MRAGRTTMTCGTAHVSDRWRGRAGSAAPLLIQRPYLWANDAARSMRAWVDSPPQRDRGGTPFGVMSRTRRYYAATPDGGPLYGGDLDSTVPGSYNALTGAVTEGRRMRKSDISSHVATQASLLRAVADSAVNAMFSVMGDALASGRATTAGFGRFSTKDQPARQRRNRTTGKWNAGSPTLDPSSAGMLPMNIPN